MACTEVDRLETVSCSAIENHCETVCTPDFILSILFGIFDFALYICTVCSIKIGAQGSFSHFTKNSLPCKPELHLLPKITPWLFQTPYERPRIEPGRLPMLLSPLGNFVAQASSLR